MTLRISVAAALIFLSVSSSSFAQWSQVGTLFGTPNSIYFVDEQMGWVAGTDGYIARTTNGGLNWMTQTSGTIYTLNDMYFVNEDTGWVVGSGQFSATILRTTNGGAEWTPQVSNSSSLYSVKFLNATEGWATGSNGSIVHTTDAGETWVPQQTGTSIRITDLFMHDKNRGWGSGWSGAIVQTTNGGEQWTISFPTNAYTNAICFVDSNRGWACGSVPGVSGIIIHTTNAGVSWSVQPTSTIYSLTSIVMTDLLRGWAVGIAGTILRTTDGGATWTSEASGTTSSLLDVFFHDSGLGWAVGDFLQVLKYEDVIDCSNITSFNARCNMNGAAQAMVKMSGDLTGETVTFDLDGDNIVSAVMSNGTNSIAKMTVPHAGYGSHTVTLEDPAGCYSPVTFHCQVDAPPDPEWDDLWNEYEVMGHEATVKLVPSETRLIGNYPNPFNPSTTFRYGLSEPGQVSLKVYNMLGQLVRTIVDEEQLEGYHEALWNGRNEVEATVSSGIYIYRMTAGTFVETKRMLLIK